MVAGRKRNRNPQGQFAPERTAYNSGNFDSRLEARWALFFDILSIGRRYDNAERNLGEGSRFLLPRFGDFRLLVRPSIPVLADIRRAKRWVYEGIAQEVVILSGKPASERTYSGYSWWRNDVGDFGESGRVLWRECLWCSTICLATDNVACPNPGCEERDTLSDSTARLATAYKLARSVKLFTAEPAAP